MIIAIDGPAGAGKSTIAKLLARRLGFLYIDTGAMYRAVTLKVIESSIDPSDTKAVIGAASVCDIGLINNADGSLKVTLDGRDVSRLIREPRIAKLVSDIAKVRQVREVMVKLQRKLGGAANSILDGRDIGSVVFPDAEKKFYLDADFNERVGRRFKELKEAGMNVTLEDIAQDLRNRDTIDSTRECAPLKVADGAQRVDTTDMTIEQVVEALMRKIIDG